MPLPQPQSEQAHKSLLEQKKEAEERKQQQYWKTIARQRDSTESMTKEQAQEEARKRAIRLHQELERDYYRADIGK